MKKAAKLVNAFKAFEIKNKNTITGGKLVVTWIGKDQNGTTICDLGENGQDVICSIPDSGARVK